MRNEESRVRCPTTTSRDSTVTADPSHLPAMSTPTSTPPDAPSPATAISTPSAPTTSPHSGRRVRWAMRFAAGGVVIAALYFGVHWFTGRLSSSVTDDAFVEAHIVNIQPPASLLGLWLA